MPNESGAKAPFSIHKEYWEFKPEWVDYVKRKWKGLGRVEQVKDDPEIYPFRDRARQAFEAQGITVNQIKTWVNCQVPKSGEGYDDGYPHIHYPLNGTTLVHYLYPGNKPAPLDIFIDNEVVETVYPEPGLTVFMPNDLCHGVRKNNGTDNRLCMIATALR